MSELFDSLNFPSQRSFGASPSQGKAGEIATCSQSSSQTSNPDHFGASSSRTPFRRRPGHNGQGDVGSASTASTSITTPANAWSTAGAGRSADISTLSSVQRRRPAGHVYWHASPSPSLAAAAAAAAACEDGSHVQVSPLGTQAFREELLRGLSQQHSSSSGSRKCVSSEKKRAKRRSRNEHSDQLRQCDQEMHQPRVRKSARRSEGAPAASNTLESVKKRKATGSELKSFLSDLEGRLQLDDDEGEREEGCHKNDPTRNRESIQSVAEVEMHWEQERWTSKARSLSQDRLLLSYHHRKSMRDKCIETNVFNSPPHQDGVDCSPLGKEAGRVPWTKTISSPCLGRWDTCYQESTCTKVAAHFGKEFAKPTSRIDVSTGTRDDVFAKEMDDSDVRLPQEETRQPLQPRSNESHVTVTAPKQQQDMRQLQIRDNKHEATAVPPLRRSTRTPVKAASTTSLPSISPAAGRDEVKKEMRRATTSSQFLRQGGSAIPAVASSSRSLGVGLSRARSGPMITTRSRVGLSRSSSSRQHHIQPTQENLSNADTSTDQALSPSFSKSLARVGPSAPFKRPSRVASSASKEKDQSRAEVVVISDDSEDEVPREKVAVGADELEQGPSTVHAPAKGETNDVAHHVSQSIPQSRNSASYAAGAREVKCNDGSRMLRERKTNTAAAVRTRSKSPEKKVANRDEQTVSCESIPFPPLRTDTLRRGEREKAVTPVKSTASYSPDKTLRSSIAHPKPRIIGAGSKMALTTPVREKNGREQIRQTESGSEKRGTGSNGDKSQERGQQRPQQQQQLGSDDSFELDHLTELDEILTARGW